MAASEMDLISAESCPGYTLQNGVTYCSGVSNKQNLISHIAISQSISENYSQFSQINQVMNMEYLTLNKV
mgnify:CR=1 FL=1